MSGMFAVCLTHDLRSAHACSEQCPVRTKPNATARQAASGPDEAAQDATQPCQGIIPKVHSSSAKVTSNVTDA